MKKLLFAGYSLDIGGIEKSLLTLVNYLQQKDYEITLVLEKKQGIFLNELNHKIKVIEYKPDENKNVIVRKLKNITKRIRFIIKYKNKFDFAASFATYSIPSSFIARTASKNNCLWGHADYYSLYNKNEKEMKQFFKQRNYAKFKHIVFVSEEGKNSFINIFPHMKEKTLVCNNLIDGEKIRKLAQEKINLKKEENTFINVGRHDERQKKLTRLIEATERLKKEKYKFRVLLIGEGPDTKKYQELVKQKQLEENILFLGKKQNPYPYFNISDCVILTSDYEGYPVVFLESFILEKPIITTKVSDYKQVDGKFGLITEKTVEDIYKAMKQFIENGFKINEQFDYENYNHEITQKLEKLF